MSNYLIITLLVSSIALATVNAAIPSYINVCKRNDPQLSKCVEKSVESLRNKLASGIPELGVPSLDPLFLTKLNLNLGTGFQADAQDLKVSGGKNFVIKKFEADVEKDFYEFEIFIPELNVVGVYELDAKIAGIPLKGKGPLTLTLKSVTGKAKLYGKRVRRAGETRYYFPKMALKLELKDYAIQLANLVQGDPAIGEATNKILNQEKTEVLNVLVPAVEKSLTERILEAANKICEHFTFDELLPVS